MKLSEIREFPCDPNLFQRSDVQTALKIHHEYVKRHSSAQTPQFFEVSQDQRIDPIMHSQIGRLKFTDRSPIGIPAINTFVKPDWRLTVQGKDPARRDNFWVSHLSLIEQDYFPISGEFVHWNGYRYEITKASPDPSAYWQQTNIWLGLTVECIVSAQGDAALPADVSKPIPAEVHAINPVYR